MLYEVEQKYPLADHAEIERRLQALGAAAGEACEQVDQYFSHPARDFAQSDEALRIRSIGEANFVTYKGPKIDATTKTRREIELPLSAGRAAAEDFATLLAALGFSPVQTVRKQRRTLHLRWENYDVEVALDEVADLGAFLELELKSDKDHLDAARAALASLALELKLGPNERRGYLQMLQAR